MKPLQLADLPAELQSQVRKDLGLPLTNRQSKFSKEDVRRFALKAMASLSTLAQAQRSRVLQHCLRLNKV